MTLTSILPTLRASIPDPLDAQRWPAGTHEPLSIVVTAVVSATVARDGTLVLVIDADLTEAEAALPALRVLGRASRARCVMTTICVPGRTPTAWGEAMLPSDITAHDLLGVPCARTLTRHDVTPVEPVDVDRS